MTAIAAPFSKGAVKDTRFKPGKPGGPGRPKGSRDFVTELLAAMRKVEKAKAKPIFEHAWELAYDDPKLLAALLKKIVPDLQHNTGDSLPVSVHIHYGHQRVTVAQPLPAEVNGTSH